MKDINPDVNFEISEITSPQSYPQELEKGRNGITGTSMPGSTNKIALYKKDIVYEKDAYRGTSISRHLPVDGVILNEDKTKVIEEFELKGFQIDSIYKIIMPTEKKIILLASVKARTLALQFDLSSKTFDQQLDATRWNIQHDEYFYSFPFDKSQAIMIYTNKEWTEFMGSTISKDMNIRLCDSSNPSGMEIAKIQYLKGEITKYLWENENIFYFLTEDCAKDNCKDELWKIYLNK